MKKINYKVSTVSGRMILVGSDVKISEYENNATSLVFNFDSAIKETDKLIIQVANTKVTKPYKLVRDGANRYSFELPRELLVRGRLTFTVQHYDKEYLVLNKYIPEYPLYVTAGQDITNDMIESRPDLFAELMYRIEKLEKQNKSQG